MLHDTSPMIRYIMISKCHTLETRLKDSARDRMEKHPNILATNLMKEVKTTTIKKEITSRLIYLVL